MAMSWTRNNGNYLFFATMLLSHERLFQVIELCYFQFILNNRRGSPRWAKYSPFYQNPMW